MGWQNNCPEYVSVNDTQFVPQFPQLKPLLLPAFSAPHSPSQDQPNLIASEREIDKVKVCGESDVFSHLYTDHMMYEYDEHHFLFEGVTQELRYYAYVLPGAQKH